MGICLGIYFFAVLWYTIIKRPAGIHVAQFELFWSYKGWLLGNQGLGKEIIANIVLFIPFGFLCSCIFPKRSFIVPVAFAISLSIESFQQFFMRGLFEWDDMVSNTVGAVIGIGLYFFLKTLLKESFFSAVSSLVACAIAIVSISTLIIGQRNYETGSTLRNYCFQIDNADISDNRLTLTGFAFLYDKPDLDMIFVLQSMRDKKIANLSIQHNERRDVADYFGCEYSNIGFIATGEIDASNEYEIMIKSPWAILVSTGVYVSASGIHYVPEDRFAPPNIDMDFVKYGTLLVYNSDYHCWIYQFDGSLYWIMDQDFCFEDEGLTNIQYQLWTTQTDKLPQNRLDQGTLWDNLSGYFENYQIQVDLGRYRAMKRELPKAYPISYIVTGLYKNGTWFWKEYFRPYYEFE